MHAWPQVGATDSEDEAESGEDLDRIEAAAAAINQRLPPSPAAQPHEDIQVCHFPCHRKQRKDYTFGHEFKEKPGNNMDCPSPRHTLLYCSVCSACQVLCPCIDWNPMPCQSKSAWFKGGVMRTSEKQRLRFVHN